MQAELAKEVGARDGMVARLPAEVVKRYSRIAKQRKGRGVAVIKGELCMACNTTLPPQLCLMVHKGAAIENCPACMRILVHESMTRSTATDAAVAEVGA